MCVCFTVKTMNEPVDPTAKRMRMTTALPMHPVVSTVMRNLCVRACTEEEAACTEEAWQWQSKPKAKRPTLKRPEAKPKAKRQHACNVWDFSLELGAISVQYMMRRLRGICSRFIFAVEQRPSREFFFRGRVFLKVNICLCSFV